MRATIDAIDALEEFHLPPRAGGFMDQTRSFVSAMKFWSHELSVWDEHKRKHG